MHRSQKSEVNQDAAVIKDMLCVNGNPRRVRDKQDYFMDKISRKILVAEKESSSFGDSTVIAQRLAPLKHESTYHSTLL